MELHPSSPNDVVFAALDATDPETTRSRLTFLLGEEDGTVQLPCLGDLLSAAIALAAGARRKVLLPLGGSRPAELALVRRGDSVLISCYDTGATTEIVALDRRVAVRTLLEACARATDGAIDDESAEAEVTRRLAERARETEVARDPSGAVPPQVRRGGALDDPGDEVALSFGFNATIHSGPAVESGRGPMADASSCADVHALLFPGELWAWMRGRRVPLARGPIILAIQRMLVAVRAMVDAEEVGRPAHVRLRAGAFLVAVRRDRAGAISLTLGDGDHDVTATALDVPGAALPILRLASDVLRALVATDRRQARNLRVRSMRAEVRALRKRVRRRERSDGFVNHDPDRLRIGGPGVTPPATRPPVVREAAPGRLRFAERWRIEVDELDAGATFLCGDRLVVSGPRRSIAVCRESGDVLWVREGLGGASYMAGRVLLRQSPDGEVELCDVADGESFAHAWVAPRIGGPGWGLHAGTDAAPLVVLTEGANSLVALDLRNGIPRWRFTAPAGATFHVRRSGRILLVVSGDGSVDALDTTTGEVVWRFAESARFAVAPVVCGDVVVAAAADVGRRRGTLYGLDLFSGESLWSRRLDAIPAVAPVSTGLCAAVSLGNGRRASLACFEPADGSLRWMVPDPGLSMGGAALDVDRSLVVNAPGGRITSLDMGTGDIRWTRRLSDPVADDVPRCLEPVLRGGALFVPAANVHVLRPSDGSSVGAALPCDLVPDLLRVDERGWVYVAEESGHASAYGPVPHLSLVRGGT